MQIEMAEVTESEVMLKPEILQIYQPKTQFNAGTVKWFDDSKLLKKYKGN